MNFSMLAARTAAAVAATGFIFLAGFQVFLALCAAWGGVQSDVLPPGLRIASAVSAVVLIVAGLIVLGRDGYWGASVPFGIPFGIFR